MIVKTKPSGIKYYNKSILNMTGAYVSHGHLPTVEYWYDLSVRENLNLPQNLGWKEGIGGGNITYESGARKFKYCDHQKFSELQDYNEWSNVELENNVDPKYYGLVIWKYSSKYWMNYIAAYGGAGASKTPVSPPSIPDGLTAIDDDFRARAWAELRPNLRSGFSLANFLWELKEIPQLVKDMAPFFRYHESIRRKVKRWKSLMKSRTLAETHLVVSFAIRPFISDIREIAENILDIRKKVEEFIDEGRTVQSYHYREPDVLSSEEIPGWSWAGKLVTSLTVTRAATLRASYSYQRTHPLFEYARYAGLEITPETIWNALPGSFVLDWVLGVGDALSRLYPDPFVTVNLVDYCDSIKVVSRTAEVVDMSGTFVTTGLSQGLAADVVGIGRTLWTWDKISYVRTPSLPGPGVSFPVPDELSARELVLAGALAHIFLLH